MNLKSPGIRYIGFFFVVLSVCNPAAQAQSPRDVVVESNRQELDSLLLRKPIPATVDTSARRAVLQQVNDDFKSIQVLNNKLMSEITADRQHDYKSVASLISDINSKASRLKSNLALPKHEPVKTDIEVTQEADLKERLLAFDKVVERFVNNPIFRETNVMKLELANQASSDLEMIIRTSAKLKKSAAKLASK
jgi:hypothetical protein